MGIGQSFELHVDVVDRVQPVMKQGLKGLKISVLAGSFNLSFSLCDVQQKGP